MNLKEAFRYQNKLGNLINWVEDFLCTDSNVTQVQTTYLRKKVMAEAQDEVIVLEQLSDYCGHINEMMSFLLYLVEQKEALSQAIHTAKAALPIDMDSQVSLNALRQQAAQVFAHMADLRSSEVLIPNGGTGYRFNAEGNQVTYRCDARRVCTINFDRHAAKKHMTALNRKADQMSLEIDRALINSQVDYEAPFDVNDSLADIFEDYLTSLQER